MRDADSEPAATEAAETVDSGASEPAPVDADAIKRANDRRARLAVALVLGAYALGLVLLVVLDQAAIVWKSLVVPGMALAALVSGRLREFVRDWALFLAAVVLFDASRGFVYGLVMHFDLPVYMGYAIHAEKAIFGEPLLTLQVQQLLSPDGKADWFDRVLAVTYGSHFVVFLLYGLMIWIVRARDFGRFKLGLMLVMYLGVIGYLIVPTVPPWMASHTYHVIPPIQELGAQLFHSTLPTVTAAFEVNPIAAMPSLHCAFPTFLTLVTFRHFRYWGIPMIGYAALVFLSTIQLGHHYGVDVLAGIALGAASFGIAYGTVRIPRLTGALTPPEAARGTLRLRAMLTGLLLLLTLMSGLYGPLLAGTDPLPTAAFIDHELEGKSPMASYYRGKRAVREHNYALAQPWLSQAVTEVPDAGARNSALGDLALSAYFNQDYRTVVWAARRLKKGFPAGLALMIAEAMVRTGDRKAGFQLLDKVSAAQPDRPEVKYMRERLEPLRSGT